MSSLPPQPLSPLDGRYFATVAELGDYLSEAGLNRARVEVEVEWLLALTDRSLFGTSPVSDADRARLRALYEEFGADEIAWLKEKERSPATTSRPSSTSCATASTPWASPPSPS